MFYSFILSLLGGWNMWFLDWPLAYKNISQRRLKFYENNFADDQYEMYRMGIPSFNTMLNFVTRWWIKLTFFLFGMKFLKNCNWKYCISYLRLLLWIVINLIHAVHILSLICNSIFFHLSAILEPSRIFSLLSFFITILLKTPLKLLDS